MFAGIPVKDYPTAKKWYERLFGKGPTFRPHDTEAVWELAGHRFVYIVELPEHAGHARHTVFLGNLADTVDAIAGRGLVPTEREEYPDGVHKITFRDPDGNEIAFGGTTS